MSFDELVKHLEQEVSYYIYGAGVVAYEIYIAVKTLYGQIPSAFLVTDKNSVYQIPQEIPVICIDDIHPDHLFPLILVATPKIYHGEIQSHLERYKITDISYIDSHMEYCLMREYFRKIKRFPLLEDQDERNKTLCSDVTKKFSIYMAKSKNDVRLKGVYDLPKWIIPVWAGNACVTSIPDERDTFFDQVPSDIMETDDIGENISFKNRDYCELTVTYWAWKNRSNDYMGLYHYRRILLLEKIDLETCMAADVDVILPLPFVCYPNASGQYLRYISLSDRKGLERALFEISPEYIPVLRQVDREPYFYNYNILIAKRKVFNDYCTWLFSVLERAERYCGSMPGMRNDRYAGYLGEILTTLYFIKNERKLNIVHGEKRWMI